MTDIRMTAERLAEIEHLNSLGGPGVVRELLQAMKAANQRISELEADLRSAGTAYENMMGVYLKEQERIRELETELYEESAAGRAARLTIVDDLNQLQRKYDALVEKITMALDAIDAEPMALREPATSVAIGRAQVSDELRALLENDDD